jgi:hypothetical protein
MSSRPYPKHWPDTTPPSSSPDTGKEQKFIPHEPKNTIHMFTHSKFKRGNFINSGLRLIKIYNVRLPWVAATRVVVDSLFEQ